MRAEYDPQRLTMVRGLTAYSDFHEHAHAEQHFRQTVAWQVRLFFFHIPVFNKLAQLAVEIEAAAMARRGMLECGIWWPGDGREATQGLLSYVLALTIFGE